MRNLSWFLAGLMALPLSPVVSAQTPAAHLNIVIVEGDGAINNIRQRTAREPIVQVEDENHKPVAGAAVVFLLPSRGATAEFPGGAHTLTVTTDAQGRAAARGLQPNGVKGQYQIQVTATQNGLTASTTIAQSNAVIGGAAGAAVTAGISGKVIAIIAVAAAAAAGGAYYATHNGSSSSSPTTTGTTIAAGAGSVGPPR